MHLPSAPNMSRTSVLLPVGIRFRITKDSQSGGAPVSWDSGRHLRQTKPLAEESLMYAGILSPMCATRATTVCADPCSAVYVVKMIAHACVARLAGAMFDGFGS